MPGNRLYNFNHAVEMEVHDCPTCGMPYAAPASFFRRVQNGEGERDNWYCPRGHSIVFRDDKVTQLKKKVEALERGIDLERTLRYRAQDEAKHQENRANGFKGALVKTKKRVGHGVCPCCTRTFKDLQRHMATKHPGYVAEEAEEGKK